MGPLHAPSAAERRSERERPRVAASPGALTQLAATVGNRRFAQMARAQAGAVDGRRLARAPARVQRRLPPRRSELVLARVSCERLLGNRASRATSGPRASEDSVQEFLADELEQTGEVVRELRIPGASAAPWRTDGGRDDTVIDPQIIGGDVTGRVDIAYHPWSRQLEFLEIKEASWQGRVFAHQQLENYVIKGNEAIEPVRREFRRRGHPYAHFDYVAGMAPSRYTPPDAPVDIDGRQVMLAWCGEGVMLFKTLDTDNREVHYCGVSDKGRTDELLDRGLGAAEEAVAKALAWRLQGLMGGPVNLRLLLQAVRDRLKASIRWFLQDTLNALCAKAFEVTLAELLAAFRRRLQMERNLVDVFLWKFTPEGQRSTLPIAEAAKNTAQALTIVLIVDTLLELAPLLVL